jgi:arginine decarboxylase
VLAFAPMLPYVPREIFFTHGFGRHKERLASFEDALRVVDARSDTNEHQRLIAASIGVAIPKEPNQYGYLSEHAAYGETDEQAGEYAEDLAASMLATTLGLEYDRDVAWIEREKQWKISGKIVTTRNETQSAQGKAGFWTTVVAAGVLIP